jgi:hypothetical protein
MQRPPKLARNLAPGDAVRAIDRQFGLGESVADGEIPLQIRDAFRRDIVLTESARSMHMDRRWAGFGVAL